MSTDEFQELWKSYDRKLESSLKMNLQLLETVRTGKIRSSFRTTIAWKIVVNILTMPWIFVLSVVAYKHHGQPVFTVSMILLILFAWHAVVYNIYHINLMRRIDLARSITATQQQLAELESSILHGLRIQFLQTPIWTVFFISKDMLLHGGLKFWLIEGTVIVLFILLTIWLYRNITLSNVNRWWIKSMIRHEGGASIARARSFIREIEDFKREL